MALMPLMPVALAAGAGACIWALKPARTVAPVGGIRVPGTRVCIVMFSTPNIVNEYAGYAARANLAYARRHGYAFEHVVGNASTVFPQWEKVRVIRDALRRHPAVFWIDSDAAFNRHETSLDTWLNLPADIVGCTDVPNGPYSVNTGALLVKSTPWTHKFMDVWWSMRALGKYQRWAFEQEAFHDLVLTDAMRCVADARVQIETAEAFNSSHHEVVLRGRRDTFVLHFMAAPNAFRAAELQEVCRRVDA